MNKEIERAYIVHDIVALRSGLASAGFSLVKKESQVNLYLDHPFLNLMVNKTYMRVRWIDGWTNAELSFSMPRVDFTAGAEVRPQYSFAKKTRKSIEAAVDILKSLGFYEVLVLEKDRELLTISGSVPIAGTIHVEIDTNVTVHPRNVDDLPGAKRSDTRLDDTVQICVETGPGVITDAASAGKSLVQFAREIGLDEGDITAKNYFERYCEA